MGPQDWSAPHGEGFVLLFPLGRSAVRPDQLELAKREDRWADVASGLDPAQYGDTADRFDITREQTANVGIGHGPPAIPVNLGR